MMGGKLTSGGARSKIRHHNCSAVLLIDNILISDDLVDARFCCNLGACHGACCVQGTSGAPLEPHEVAEVERAYEIVAKDLRPEARKVIEKKGTWETLSGGETATTCVGQAECVFVVYEGPVAKCSIQQAFQEGRHDWAKPLSCHLYPIRIQNLGDMDLLNYERMDMCLPGVAKGKRDGLFLSDFLEFPLTRKYGADWYARFKEACDERREATKEGMR